MIISSRRRSGTPLGRLLAMFRAQTKSVCVLDEDDFLFEIKKERSRVDRRNGDGEFALVVIDWGKGQPDNMDLMLVDIRERLRITDTVGWKNKQLTLLLPETNSEGALRVANEMAKVALMHDLRIESEIAIYPWDDSIAKTADEFETSYAKSQKDDDQDDDNQGGSGSSGGNSGSNTETVVGFDETVSDYVHEKQGSTTLFSVCRPTPVWKRATDIVCSAAGLTVLSPLLIVSAVAIKLSSPGPVFFLQKREGKDGQDFSIVKFRTMSADAEQQKDSLRHKSEQDGPAFKLKNDPRVTTVGRYLRKTCIDELPQLFNVLAGQMSMVGPRPLPVDESTACRVWQRKRLEVLPGITCIWQVHGGRDTKFDEWMRMDMEYLRRRSFSYDLQLIVETAMVAVMHRGSV